MKIGVTALLFLFVPCAHAFDIIPLPNFYEKKKGFLKIPDVLTVHTTDAEFEGILPVVNQMGQQYFNLTFSKTKKNAFIQLVRNNNISNAEQYFLQITDKKIRIESGSARGFFYAMQSLMQLLWNSRIQRRLPQGIIRDQPRFLWRGLMLDESRQFYGIIEVKKMLDFMAIHKLNIFHWHLTDDAGWRIEIKQYPLLTTIGAEGNANDPKAPARFYTQQQIREIVDYAAKRFITIVPEIDMPGHATAAVRAYPQYSGGGSQQNPHFTFNPGLDSTYTFLGNILREAAELFPTPYMHIGGDEVHFGNQQWPNLPAVKQLMKDQNLENPLQVEHYFLKRMADSVQQLGRKTIGWDEIVSAGLAPANTVVMWWRHNRPQVLQQALNKGYQVILCPRLPMYFDFVQHSSHYYGRKWDTLVVSLAMVYKFPTPDMLGGTLPSHPLIKGIQANLWTPDMHTPQRLQFMLYPRLSALAEAAWTNDNTKNFEGFSYRLRSMLMIYRKQGIQFFDLQTPGYDKEIEGLRSNVQVKD